MVKNSTFVYGIVSLSNSQLDQDYYHGQKPDLDLDKPQLAKPFLAVGKTQKSDFFLVVRY